MNKVATGMLIGGIVGVSSVVFMNLDKKDLRKVQRKGRQILTKAEDLLDDIKTYM